MSADPKPWALAQGVVHLRISPKMKYNLMGGSAIIQQEALGGDGFEIAQKNGGWFRYSLLGVLFLSLWFFRFGIHGWDNGIFQDDWVVFGTVYISGHIPTATEFFSGWSFLRPLGFLLVTNLSRFWEYFWIIHLMNSVIHGMNALLVFSIAHSLSFGFLGSFLTSLFFLLFPIPSEATNWAGCIHNVLGATIGSAGILIALRYGTKEVGYKLLLTGMTFVSVMLYEQSAMLLGASSLICIFREIKEKGWNFRRISLCLLPWICLGGYFLLERMSTASIPGDRFSINSLSLIPIKYLWILTTYMNISIFGKVARDFLGNGFWLGMKLILLNGWLIFLFLGIASLTIWSIGLWAKIRIQDPPWKPGRALGVSVIVILLTLSLFSMNREYALPFRVTYAPSIGLSLLIGFAVAWFSRLIRNKRLYQLFSISVVLILVFTFLPVNYNELFQYRRQSTLNISQAHQLISLVPQVNDGSFFWLLNVPWATQNLNVLHGEHVVNIWIHSWSIKGILSCLYKKNVDGKPLYACDPILPGDFPPSPINTYVFWFDKDSFYPVSEILLLGASGEGKRYRFPSMEHLADSRRSKILRIKAAESLGKYPTY
jgi:hypothetical protein